MIISWFSGGVTSAVATKLAIKEYVSVLPVFIETGSHHKDMSRFIIDCEDWFGLRILTLRDKRFKDHIDLCEKLRVVNFVGGAECSRTLKKRVRQAFEKIYDYDGQIFGFEYEKKEFNRAVRFKEQYPDSKPLFPLIDKKLNKQACLDIVQRVGIATPEMYKLGYSNNNCIGCVKGGMGYWNKIRNDFPEIFNRMANAERTIGHSCIKNCFLDELKKEQGRTDNMIMPECDLFCEIEARDILADETKREFYEKEND